MERFPVTIEHSAWHRRCRGTLRNRVVLRRLSADKYAVHREVEDQGRRSHCWGHYFEQATHADALGAALQCFAKKAGDFEHQYSAFLEL